MSSDSRVALRQNLLAQRQSFATAPESAAAFLAAQASLSAHLVAVLHQIEPQSLGLYWPMRFEFHAVQACAADPALAALDWSLPFATRQPRQMRYRAWDQSPPAAVDECGVASTLGAPVDPDVVLVPCVGYTVNGYRLGYGGGYFDRYLAAHPGVTAIGLAWASAVVDETALQPQAHDVPLTLVITERGVVGAPD